MSNDTPTYTVGDELPSLAISWYDSDGDLIDFATGWTFRLRVGRGDVAVLEKTTGITGAATAPNVTVDWAADELATLTERVYVAQLRARRTADSKDRTYQFQLNVNPEMGAVPSP